MSIYLGFDGAETGDFSAVFSTSGSPSVQTSIKRSGAYAYRCPSGASLSEVMFINNLSLARMRARVWSYIGVTTPPSAAFSTSRHIVIGGDGQSLLRFDVTYNTNGTVTIQVKRAGGTANLGSSFSVPTGQWNVFECFAVPGATGQGEVKLNGTVVASASGVNMGTSTIVSLLVGSSPLNTNGLVADHYYDDCAWGDDASTGPVMTGRCILRKVKAGSPTYDAFTKQNGGVIAAEWADLPFSATNNARSSAIGQAQTALVDDVATGTDPIGVADVIHACKVSMMAKTL